MAPVGDRDRASVIRRLREAGCVFAEEEAELLLETFQDPAGLDQAVAARAAGRPLEHLLGWVAWGGRRLHVGEGVFVPRQRSVLLVRSAAQVTGPLGVLVELCCGCAAIGATIAADREYREVHAADADPEALTYARRNLPPGAQLHCGHLFDPLPASLRGRVDLLVASPPYVPTAEIGGLPREARDYEPRTALDGGPDGLAIAAEIVGRAAQWLTGDGVVLVECGPTQADRLADHCTAAGLRPQVLRDRDSGGTVVRASPR